MKRFPKRVDHIPGTGRAPYTCSLCGEPGHSKTYCGDQKPVKGDMLTEDQFWAVRGMRIETQLFSADIAKELQLPLMQTNYAIIAPSYDRYVRHYPYQKT